MLGPRLRESFIVAPTEFTQSTAHLIALLFRAVLGQFRLRRQRRSENGANPLHNSSKSDVASEEAAVMFFREIVPSSRFRKRRKSVGHVGLAEIQRAPRRPPIYRPTD